MNQKQDERKGNDQPWGVPTTFSLEWLNTAIHSLMRMFSGGGEPQEPLRPTSMPQWGNRPEFQHSQVRKRTLVSYINTGIYKYERARRSSAIAKQYQVTLRTIRLTRQAIRRAPRSNRYLFQGYSTVLRDAKRRVKQINVQIRHLEVHIRQYNPPAIEEEITRIERGLQTTTSPSTRMDMEMRLEARRDLLDTVQGFDEKIEELAAQLCSIAAALELNHVKIVTLSGSASYTSQDELLTMRMQEVTEQLKLLEESLRELE